MFNEQALNGIDAREVIFGLKWNKDVAAIHLLQTPDQMAPEDPGTARYYDPLVLKRDHECHSSATTVRRSASVPPFSRDSTSFMSASTMIRTSSAKVTARSQPSTRPALDASAHRSSASAGRK